MAALLHVDPRHAELDLPDEVAEQVVKLIHHYVLVAGRGEASQAFCLLIAAIGDLVARTDAPIDLLNIAVELLMEQRAELIAAGQGPTLLRKSEVG